MQSAVETTKRASDTAYQVKAEMSVLEEQFKRVRQDTKSMVGRLQPDVMKRAADRISQDADVNMIGLDEPVPETE